MGKVTPVGIEDEVTSHAAWAGGSEDEEGPQPLSMEVTTLGVTAGVTPAVEEGVNVTPALAATSCNLIALRCMASATSGSELWRANGLIRYLGKVEVWNHYDSSTPNCRSADSHTYLYVRRFPHLPASPRVQQVVLLG